MHGIKYCQFYCCNEEIQLQISVNDTAFPELNEDFLGKLVDNAIISGQITDRYDREYVKTYHRQIKKSVLLYP